MSTAFEIVDDVDCDVSRYWDVFFDEDYNRSIYAQVGVRERVWLDGPRDEGELRRWRLRIMPTRDLPGFIKKVVKGDLGYVETAALDRRKNTIDVHIAPTLLSERTTFRATYVIEPLAPGRVRRTFAGKIHVDLPVVGKIIERFIIDDVRRSYSTVARLTSEWCAAHPSATLDP
jgi:hypothetical protein